MDFLAYEKDGNKVALNINLVKEIYVKEAEENVLELWADDKRIHILSKSMIQEYIENIKNSDAEIISLFYRKKALNKSLLPRNKRILQGLELEEFLELFRKIEENNLYKIFKEFYPIAIIRMMAIEEITVNLRENKVETATGWFCVENLIAIMYLTIKKI